MVPSQYHPRGLFHVFTVVKRSPISQRSSTPSQGSGESYTHARCVRVLKEVLDAICDNLGRLVNWSYSQEIRTLNQQRVKFAKNGKSLISINFG
jgi:hypothetical protein